MKPETPTKRGPPDLNPPSYDLPVNFRMTPADVCTITFTGQVVATMTVSKRVMLMVTGPVTVQVEKLAEIRDQAAEALRDG